MRKFTKNHFQMKYIICIILAIILMSLVVIVTSFALFFDKSENLIDINFNKEKVIVDASMNLDKTNTYADVTLLKFFEPSEEMKEIELLEKAQITLLQSTKNSVKIRFKIGYEYFGVTNVTNDKLKTILSALNNTFTATSYISETPFSNFKWVYNTSTRYFELKNGSAIASINTTSGNSKINIIDKIIKYSGISNLNLDLGSLTSDEKKILEKLSLNLQVEVVNSYENFTQPSSVYTYGKVAIFENEGGNNVSAKLLPSNGSLSLPSAVKDNLVFQGWYRESTLNTLLGKSGQTITQTVNSQIYYAKFDFSKTTITLNPNGGKLYDKTSLHQIPNVIYGSDFLSSDAVTTKNGYDFLGYYDAQGICYIDKNGKASRKWDKTDSAVTLTARYSNAKEYSIVYTNINADAYFGSTAVHSYTYGSPITIPNPLRAGYTFNGWKVNNENNLIKDYRINADVCQTIYLEANFTLINYTATIKNGSSTTSAGFTIESAITLPQISQAYAGFKVQSNSGNWKAGEIYPANSVISGRFGNVTLITENKSDNILFNLNCDDPTAMVEPKGLGVNNNCIVKMPNAYRRNHVFLGWYFDSACTRLCPREFVFNKNEFRGENMLYAKWKEVNYTPKYTVTLHNGSSSTSTTFTLNSGNKFIYDISNNVSIPSKNGYTFNGYYTKENGQGIKFYSSSGVREFSIFTSAYTSNYEETFDLYASWSENLYTIEFDSNGGISLPSIYYTITTNKVSYPRIGRLGYNFSGWQIISSSGSNWGGGNLPASPEITTLNKYGNIKIKAIFSAITYNAKFNYLYMDSNKSFTNKVANSTYNIGSQSLSIPNVDGMFGHKFLGWEVISGSGSWVPGTLYKVGTTSINTSSHSYFGDVAFSAKYEVITYKIEFKYRADNADLVGDKDPDKIFEKSTKPLYFSYENKEIKLRDIVFIKGYKFISWSPLANSGEWKTSDSFESGQSVSITSGRLANVTLVCNGTQFFAGGDGTANKPFQIANVGHLKNLSYVISNNYDSHKAYATCFYVLNGNITFVNGDDYNDSFTMGSTTYNRNFNSIGTSQFPFKGVFDGKDFTITNLRTKTSSKGLSGLFGYVSEGTIRNLTLATPKIYTTSAYASAIVSSLSNHSEVYNCKTTTNNSECNISGGSGLSGIASYVDNSVVRNCENALNIESKSSGIAGCISYMKNNSVAYNLINRGTLNLLGTGKHYDVGGVIGKMGNHENKPDQWGSCLAINLYNAGNLNVETGYSSVGGVLGFKGYVSFAFNMYSDGIVNYKGSYSASGCVGAGNSYAQEGGDGSSNGLYNRYYKINTFKDGTGKFVNYSNCYSKAIDTKSSVNTDYSIYNCNHFISLASVMNAWIYFISEIKNYGSMQLRYYKNNSAEYEIQDSLIDLLACYGINFEDLNYWQRDSSGNMKLKLNNGVPDKLNLKIIDKNAGLEEMNLIYIELTSSSDNDIYSDSSNILASSLIREGYKPIKISNRLANGTVNIELQGSDNHFEISPNYENGTQKLYVIWESLFAEGEGTSDKPFIISNENHLYNLSSLVNSNANKGLYATAYYQQVNDIRLTKSFTPIGNGTYNFKGYYDGRNKIIYFSKSIESSNDYVGLFGIVSGASIKSIKISCDTAFIKGNNFVGGIAGKAQNSNFSNCVNLKVNIKGNDCVGGIVGKAEKCAIENCTVNSQVTGSSNVGQIYGQQTN